MTSAVHETPGPVLAEPALVLVNLVATWSLTRLFDSAVFLPRLLAIGVVAHLLALLTRRLHWPGYLRVALFVLGLGVMVTAVYLPATGVGGFFPTGGTLSTGRQLMHDGWAQFSSVRAPAPALPGFVIVAAMALWATAWLSDWIAFRAWAAVEALMPATAIFVFAAVLGTPDRRVASAGLFAVSCLAFVGLHRAGRDGAASSWVANRHVQGGRALVLSCLPVVLLAGAIGALAGPMLPGADQPALTGWRHLDQNSSDTSLASPFVDLRKRIISQSNTELFTVKADHRSYWRLMSLEQFDGHEWKSSGSFSDAGDDVPHQNQPADRTRTIHQTFHVTATGAIWAPAAFEVSSVKSSTKTLRWDPGAGALIAGGKQTSADGLSYSLVSQTPDPTASQVSTAPDSIPEAIGRNYLALPGIDARVARQAREVTSGVDGPAAKAKALEEWFRAPGNFTYSLTPTGGQSSDALAEFLFQSRQGYCQQFAAAFAVMARTLGIPSRVAVGYTWGDYDAATGTYHVKGRNAHAWPEVWLKGVGWLPFDPTPGRGLPDAGAWSSTRAAQDDGTGAPDAPQSSTAPGGVTGGTSTSIPPLPTTAPAAPSTAPADRAGGPLAGAGPKPPSRWNRLAPWGLGLLAAAAGWWLIVSCLLLARRRRRRRLAGADGTGALVSLAWLEATEALVAVGLGPLRSESHAEFANRVGRAWTNKPGRPTPVGAVGGLAVIAADARWAGVDPPEGAAAHAQRLRDQVVNAVDGRLGWSGRLRRAFNPAPLLARRPRPVAPAAYPVT